MKLNLTTGHISKTSKLNLTTGHISKTSFKPVKMSIVKQTKPKLVAKVPEEYWKEMNVPSYTKDDSPMYLPQSGYVNSMNACAPKDAPEAFECGHTSGGFPPTDNAIGTTSIKGSPLSSAEQSAAINSAVGRAKQYIQEKNPKANLTELLYGRGNSSGFIQEEINAKLKEKYNTAIDNGFVGTQNEWLRKFEGPIGRYVKYKTVPGSYWQVQVQQSRENSPSDYYVDPTWGLKRKVRRLP